MRLVELAKKVEEMDLRQQKMDKDQAVHQQYISGMLEKILQQTTATNGKVFKNIADIETNKKEVDENIKTLTENMNTRVGIIEVWKGKVGGVVVASLIAGSVLGTIITLAFSFIFKA